ncbi:MAG: GNAT family N-acetyltransferase [Pseudomonadota bacterium]
MTPVVAEIDTARTEDVAGIATILSDWIDDTPWMPRIHTRDEDRAFCAHLLAKGVRVARTGGEPAAFLARDGDKITALYVAKAQRGSGHGSALIEDAKVASDVLELWTFQANTAAHAFYRRHGFTEIAETEGDNEESLPDVELWWTRP